MPLSSMWISNQNHFITFQVPVLTTVLDHSQVSTVSQKRQFANQCIPAGYPKTHAPFVPQAQARPTHHSPIKGSRSPSKLEPQAPTPESQTVGISKGYYKYDVQILILSNLRNTNGSY